MTYYVVVSPCVGDPEKASWYPGHVGRAYVKANPPPILAVYQTTSRREVARIVRAAVVGFGEGDWPLGTAAPKAYQPRTGDALVAVVCPLAGTGNHAPIVTTSFFPEVRRVQVIPRVTRAATKNARLLDVTIAVTLAAALL